MRLPTYEKPRIIECAEDLPKHLLLEIAAFWLSRRVDRLRSDPVCGAKFLKTVS